MIKNIIFDIGDILLQFDYLNKRFMSLKLDEQEVIKEVISSSLWQLIDYGFMDNETVAKAFGDMTNHACDDVVTEFVSSWPKYGTISDNILETLNILKTNGYKIYLLSNIDTNMHKRINEFNLLDYVDGYIFSYQVQQIKPYESIYKTLLVKYALKANECLFIDDKQANIDTALKLGFNAKKAIPDDFNDVLNILKSYNINIDRK